MEKIVVTKSEQTPSTDRTAETSPLSNVSTALNEFIDRLIKENAAILPESFNEKRKIFNSLNREFVPIEGFTDPEVIAFIKEVHETLAKREADNYADAVLLVDRMKLLKEIGRLLKSDVDARKNEAKRLQDEFHTVLTYDYFKSLSGGKESRIAAVFSIAKNKDYILYNEKMLTELRNACTGIWKDGDIFAKLAILDIVADIGGSAESLNNWKKESVETGDLALFLRVVEIQGSTFDPSELIKIGEHSLATGFTYDAIKAFVLADRVDLVETARSHHEKEFAEAGRKLKTMPEGFMTKDLMGHVTRQENFEAIMLGDGILSNETYRHKYNQVPHGLGNSLQSLVACYDYISVYDPWNGAMMRPEHAERYKQFEQYVQKVLSTGKSARAFPHPMDEPWPDTPVWTGNGGDWNKRELNDLYYYNHPDDRGLFNTVREAFLKTTKVTDAPDKKPRKYTYDYERSGAVKDSVEINPSAYFDWDAITLLIDPTMPRIPSPPSIYDGEAWIKSQVTQSDIVGVVIPPTLRNPTVIERIIRIAKKTGTPVYLNERIGGKKHDEDESPSFRILWPNPDNIQGEEQHSVESYVNSFYRRPKTDEELRAGVRALRETPEDISTPKIVIKMDNPGDDHRFIFARDKDERRYLLCLPRRKARTHHDIAHFAQKLYKKDLEVLGAGFMRTEGDALIIEGDSFEYGEAQKLVVARLLKDQFPNMNVQTHAQFDSHKDQRRASFEQAIERHTTQFQRDAYKDIVANRAIRLGCDMARPMILLEGSNDIAYMTYASENGTSFGFDTLYLAYIDKNGRTQTKEVLRTRDAMTIQEARVEDGHIHMICTTRTGDKRVDVSVEEIAHAPLVSDLNTMEEQFLNMFMEHQDAIGYEGIHYIG